MKVTFVRDSALSGGVLHREYFSACPGHLLPGPSGHCAKRRAGIRAWPA